MLERDWTWPRGAAVTEGAELRDRGMAVANAAQERDAPGWSDRAYAAIDLVAHVYRSLVYTSPAREVATTQR